MDPVVSVSLEAGVVWLTLRRVSKRNALNRQVLQELLGALQTAPQDPHARVLVLAAEGPVFCAGMDIGEMQAWAAMPDASDQWYRDSQDYAAVLQSLFDLPLPTVAAVQGPALAGGVGLVAACDLVVAAESAFFALPEPARGIIAAMVTPLLIHRIGHGPAAQMLLSGESCSALTALRYGLCYDVVAADLLGERVDRLTQSICQGAPAALAQTKAFMRECRGRPLDGDMQEAIQRSAAARQTEAAREGLLAFLEKRKPAWQDEKHGSVRSD